MVPGGSHPYWHGSRILLQCSQPQKIAACAIAGAPDRPAAPPSSRGLFSFRPCWTPVRFIWRKLAGSPFMRISSKGQTFNPKCFHHKWHYAVCPTIYQWRERRALLRPFGAVRPTAGTPAPYASAAPTLSICDHHCGPGAGGAKSRQRPCSSTSSRYGRADCPPQLASRAPRHCCFLCEG